MSSADPRELAASARRWSRSWPARYGFAVVMVAIATALQFGLLWLGPFHLAFILYYPAVVVIAMWAGFWPGIVGTLLATFAGDYFFLEPRYSFAVQRPEDVIGPALFSIIGASLTLLTCSRTEATEALKESETDLNRAQAVAHIGSWRIDLAKNAIMLSDEAYRIIGLPPGEPVSMEQAISLLHPDDRERVLRDWTAALKTGSYEGEDRVLVQGNTRWVRIQATVESDGDGRAQSVLGTIQDVTERKRAEQSLRLFRALIDQSTDAVEVVDPETMRFLDINEKACRDLGYSRDEILAMTVFDINPALDEARRATVLKELRDRGFVVQQGVHLRKDGSTFPVETSLSRVDLDRKYVVAVSRDISERKRAEDALRESDDRYRDLIEHSEDLVCTHDLEGRLLSVNPSAARDLGYEIDEFLKIPMRDLIVPEHRVLYDEYLVRIKDNGSDKGLMCMLARSGEIRTWEYNNTLRTEGVATPIVRGMAHDVTEKRRAELALCSSEQRYQMLFEKMVAGVALTTIEGRLIDCNDAWARMFGYGSAEECRGIQVADCYLHPGEREVVLAGLERSGAFFDREYQFRRKDGTPFWGLPHSVLLSEGQEPPLIQSTVIDISTRMKAEIALLQSEAHFRILVEQASDGIFIADAQGRYLDVNSAGAAMLGYAREEILRRSVADVVAAEEHPRIALELARLLGGGSIRSEWKFRRADGSFFPGEVCGKRLPDGRLQGILRDMTERKRAEEILQHSEERFRVALKDSPITVFSQDRDLRYTWIYNPHLYWQKEIIGKSDDEIIGAERARSLVDLKRRVLETGAGLRAEVVIPHNGTKYSFDVTIEPLFDSDRNVIGITGASMDVARLRELADRLHETKEKLAQEKLYLESEIETELGFEEIIGQSKSLREVLKKTRVVAPTDSTVLLLGETGTGKELVARSVHALSPRHDQSFIKLNCAAVPSGLLESELFGHEKGAFYRGGQSKTWTPGVGRQGDAVSG